MELIRGLHNLLPKHNGCVATIGNFDGVHVGHQAIVNNLDEKSKQLGLPSLVITFEPQPDEYFLHEGVPPRLTRLREKLTALKNNGVDRVLVLQFNTQLANLSAQQFIKQILVQQLGVKYLVVGEDFKFGARRAGDFSLLQQAGRDYGFEVTKTHNYEVDNHRVSSTLIRESLSSGDLNRASQLLGHPYGMCGRVAHGDKRGRIIGFPTANVYLHRKVSPILGVFAVKVYGLNREPVLGVANIGNRPTVGGSRTLLEAHLFDFDQEIYGHYIQVDFIHKLRDEKRFDNFELLKQQIFKDAQQARAYFND